MESRDVIDDVTNRCARRRHFYIWSLFDANHKIAQFPEIFSTKVADTDRQTESHRERHIHGDWHVDWQ